MRLTLAAVAGLFLCAIRAWAHPGPAGAGRELLEILRDADYVLIGHLTSDPIEVSVNHGAYRHTATLAVTRLIKGDPGKPQMRIMFHHEIRPLNFRGDQALWDVFVAQTPGERVALLEDNMGSVGPDNLRKDCIWLLTRRLDRSKIWAEGDLEISDLPGVWEMNDVQPLDREKSLRVDLGLPRDEGRSGAVRPDHTAKMRWWPAGLLVLILGAGFVLWLVKRRTRRASPSD